KNIRPGQPCFIRGDPIVKDTSDATGFMAMFDVKIAIGMRFERWIKCRAIPVANRFERLMEIGGVIQLHVMRGQIYPAPKPPNLVIQLEIPDIHVYDGHEWVVRMNDNGDAG